MMSPSRRSSARATASVEPASASGTGAEEADKSKFARSDKEQRRAARRAGAVDDLDSRSTSLPRHQNGMRKMNLTKINASESSSSNLRPLPPSPTADGSIADQAPTDKDLVTSPLSAGKRSADVAAESASSETKPADAAEKLATGPHQSFAESAAEAAPAESKQEVEASVSPKQASVDVGTTATNRDLLDAVTPSEGLPATSDARSDQNEAAIAPSSDPEGIQHALLAAKGKDREKTSRAPLPRLVLRHKSGLAPDQKQSSTTSDADSTGTTEESDAPRPAAAIGIDHYNSSRAYDSASSSSSFGAPPGTTKPLKKAKGWTYVLEDAHLGKVARNHSQNLSETEVIQKGDRRLRSRTSTSQPPGTNILTAGAPKSNSSERTASPSAKVVHSSPSVAGDPAPKPTTVAAGSQMDDIRALGDEESSAGGKSEASDNSSAASDLTDLSDLSELSSEIEDQSQQEESEEEEDEDEEPVKVSQPRQKEARSRQGVASSSESESQSDSSSAEASDCWDFA